MQNVCKICNEPIKNDRHFFQEHRISAAEYYVKYFARKDLQTGEPISYKNKLQYFKSYFSSASNMKKWILSVDKGLFIKFITILIKNRHKIKALNKPLCSLELMSLEEFPSLELILKRISISDYKKIFSDLNVTKDLFIDYSLKAAPIKSLEIGIDTREQQPLRFENSRSFKMDYGDYTALGEHFENVFIDRKSGPDFVSTFGGDISRFKKEIERAADFGAYLVVLVEVKVYLLKTGRGRLFAYTKCSPEMIFHNVREVIQDYDNVQFLFVESRVEAKRALPIILSYGSKVNNIDLQHLYNEKKL